MSHLIQLPGCWFQFEGQSRLMPRDYRKSRVD